MLRFFMSCVVSRLRAHTTIRTYKKSGSLMKHDYDDEKTDFSSKNSREMGFINGDEMKLQDDDECKYGNNRVMVVVNGRLEAKNALNWALTHAIHSHDTVVLLHVSKPCKQGGNSNREINQRAKHKILCSMESMCKAMRPGVNVERVVKEGKEKGSVIVEEAKQQRVTLLVLWKRKKSSARRIGTMLYRKRVKSNEMMNYCIQNANCMTIAVRRKSNKYGGYLITTKSHKNFWLLA